MHPNSLKKPKSDTMTILMDYVEDITHALKVGFFLSFIGTFLTLITFVVKVMKDQNGNNQ